MNSVTYINKEELAAINFAKEPAVTDQVQRKLLLYDLNRALLLGNLYQQKVKLVFRTDRNEPRRVETTIWAVTEEYVLLKGSLFVPIRAIEHIEF